MIQGSLSGRVVAILQTQSARAGTGGAAAALAIAAVFGSCPDARAANTYFVNTTGDPGPPDTVSLRQAVALASNGDTVKFDASLTGSTITLQSGEIVIDKLLTIDGPGPEKLAISGNDASGILHISLANQYTPIFVSGLTLTHGNAGYTYCGGVCPDKGGAISVENAYLYLSDARLIANEAGYGGGLSLLNASASVQDSVISGNLAGARGGGIWWNSGEYASLSVSRSTISGNGGSFFGGAGLYAAVTNFVNNATPKLLIDRSTISGNRGMNNPGGGLFLNIYAGTTTISSSTIAQNFSYSGGGGLYIKCCGNTQVSYSSIVGNSTHEAKGHGIYVQAGSVLQLRATIVANNYSSGDNVDTVGDFQADYCLLKNPGSSIVTGSNNLFFADPMLGTLADHGGPTMTMMPSPSSPVVDAGGALVGPPVDQRGFARIVNMHLDIGPVELQQPEDIVFRSGFGLCTLVQKC